MSSDRGGQVSASGRPGSCRRAAIPTCGGTARARGARSVTTASCCGLRCCPVLKRPEGAAGGGRRVGSGHCVPSGLGTGAAGPGAAPPSRRSAPARPGSDRGQQVWTWSCPCWTLSSEFDGLRPRLWRMGRGAPTACPRRDGFHFTVFARRLFFMRSHRFWSHSSTGLFQARWLPSCLEHEDAPVSNPFQSIKAGPAVSMAYLLG